MRHQVARRTRRSAAARAAASGVLLLFLAGCDEPRKQRFVPPPAPPPQAAPVKTEVPKPPPPVKPVPPPVPQVTEEELKQNAAALLFPRGSGDTWEMVEKTNGKSIKIVLTALGEQSEADKTTFFVEMKRGAELVQTEGYSADKTGVYRIAAGPSGKGRINPPLPMLKLPIQPNSAWTWQGMFEDEEGRMSAQADFKLTGPESVKTPAGEFKAYRIEQTFTLFAPEGMQTVKNTQWLAPKVGLVKQTTDGSGSKTVAELTAYRIGPDRMTR